MPTNNEIFKRTMEKADQLQRIINESKKHASKHLMGSGIYLDFTNSDYITINTLEHLNNKDLVFGGITNSRSCYVSTLELKNLNNPTYGVDTWMVSCDYVVFKDK